MKIGVVADTHGNLEGWHQVWELLRDSDYIIHCGDLLYHGPRFQPVASYDPRALAHEFNQCPVPMIFVRGNGDSEVDSMFVDAPIQSPYAYVQVECVRFLATHGHQEPIEQTVEHARAYDIDYLLTAHLHVPQVSTYGSLTHINPGTPTYPLSENPKLSRPTCAAVIDGKVVFYAVDTGEELPIKPTRNK